MDNKTINKDYYDNVYSKTDIDTIVKNINNFENYYKELTNYHIDWVGFYKNNFHKNVKNKKILELGCGNGTNSAILAKLGAEVYANDISQFSEIIIKKLNEKLTFDKNINFVSGDFLDANLESNMFDMVVGKAFVHHLTHEEEDLFMQKIINILKPEGIVRFFEPAVNSRMLDEIRWLIPVPGRPSKLQINKFKNWKKNDHHPERDNSTNSYSKIGKKYFKEFNISHIGTLERFSRLIPNGHFNLSFRKHAYSIEKYIPKYINMKFARAQVVDYRFPKK